MHTAHVAGQNPNPLKHQKGQEHDLHRAKWSLRNSHEYRPMPTSSSLSGSACIEFSDLLVPWLSSTLIHEDDSIGCRKVLQLPACRAVIFGMRLDG